MQHLDRKTLSLFALFTTTVSLIYLGFKVLVSKQYIYGFCLRFWLSKIWRFLLYRREKHIDLIIPS